MIDFQKVLWTLKNLRPAKVAKLFKHIHAFENYDPAIKGYKYAILYGRMYFEHSTYKNGMLDVKERNKRNDEIIEEYKNPKDRLEYVRQLKQLRDGVETANAEGFFSCGNNTEENKIEAAHYKDAMDCLNIVIKACAIYPFLWKRVFLHS